MVVGIHMCRGKYKGKYLSEGGYDSVAEKLFNGARVNHFLLEYDTPRVATSRRCVSCPRARASCSAW